MGWKEVGEQVYAGCDEDQKRFLDHKVVMDVDDLFELETERLRRIFAAKPKGDQQRDVVNNTLLVLTLMWQTFLHVLAKEKEPPTGNVRGLWYDFTDKLYNKHDLYSDPVEDPEYQAFLARLELDPLKALDYAVMRGAKVSYIQDLTENATQALVTRRIFRYAVFKFRDPNAGYTELGKTASRIVTVEKHGLHDRYTKRYVKKLGISGIASEGQPSLLATEYLADKLLAKGIRRVVIGALTDWDCWGLDIAYGLGEKLGVYGIEAVTTPLTKLSLFTPEALRDESYPLVFPKGSTRWEEVERWFQKTGGINGEKRGIHLNSADRERVDRAVQAWLKANKPFDEEKA